MNLFRNRHKKFEEKLSQQLDGLEYRPSESLWDKISANVPEDGFEKTVAGRVETYQPKPSAGTWDYIESQLPPVREKNYRQYYWVPLLFLFSATTVYLGYELNKQNPKTTTENK